MNEPAVSVRNLTKSFSGRRVVDDLSFDVQKGEVFALLGHNGAGKSTTIDLILGLKTPDGGSAKILGMDAAQSRKQVFERAGVQLQHTQYQTNITVEEACIEYASLYADPADYHCQRCDRCAFDPDPDRRRGGLFWMPDAGQCVCVYGSLASHHGLHVLHRPHGGQPVPDHKIYECGDKSALLSDAVILRSHHPGGGVSGRVESRFRVDAPWRGDQAVEIRIHGML